MYDVSYVSKRTFSMPQLLLFVRLPVPKRDVAVFAPADDHIARKGRRLDESIFKNRVGVMLDGYLRRKTINVSPSGQVGNDEMMVSCDRSVPTVYAKSITGPFLYR